MYIGEKYKEGLITTATGEALVKVRCKVTIADENIYNALKAMAPIIDSKAKLYRINTVFKNILDKEPEAEKPTNPEVTTEDSTFTIPANEYIINNMIFTDEDIYGDAYDGVDRRYRIIWKDEKGEEHFVPLEGVDQFAAVNPHDKYSYNSETKQLIFSAFMPYSTEYILRRYYY